MPGFALFAQAYHDRGLSPLPILPNQKRPSINGWQIYCSRPVEEDELKSWLQRYADHSLGLALGTPVPIEEGQAAQDLFLIGIDIDADDLVERVKAALPSGDIVSKRGKKGLTIFVLAPSDVHNEKIKRMAEGRVDAKPSVEILAAGSETVLPPSIHPDTKQPYVWIGPSLLDVPLFRLPIIQKNTTIDEITAQCQGHGEHFDALNSMTWLGEGGGGNTHDTCVAAAGFLVQRGWDDADIRARISRAKRDSCIKVGQPYDWPEADRVIDGWIDSARKKGMTGERKKEKPSIEQLAAKFAIDRLGGLDRLACINDELREYRDGYWPLVNIKQLNFDLASYDHRIRDRDVRGSIELVKKMTGVHPVFAQDNSEGRICLLNGTLNLKTGELERHSIEQGMLHQIPVEWDEGATCPIYERFLKETFDDDSRAIDTWDEFAAHTLVPDLSHQKILFLQGIGANGKSTLASLLRSIHDSNAVASESIADLDHEYHRAALVGKLVSIASEQSRLNQVSDRYLKAIVGGDAITIRQPFHAVQSVKLFVRFIQIVNEMPRTVDLSYALQRRLIILSCPNVVADSRQDPHLVEKLFSETPGILVRWTQALRRLNKRKHFLPPKSSAQAIAQYIRDNDPVGMWVDERCQKDENGTPYWDLYSDFTMWERNNNVSNRLSSSTYWKRRMTELGYPEMTKGAGMDFRGVKIKPGMDVGR